MLQFGFDSIGVAVVFLGGSVCFTLSSLIFAPLIQKLVCNVGRVVIITGDLEISKKITVVVILPHPATPIFHSYLGKREFSNRRTPGPSKNPRHQININFCHRQIHVILTSNALLLLR